MNNLFSNTLKVFLEQYEQKKMKLTSFHKNYNSNFETNELPRGIYEVHDMSNTLDNLTKANVSIDINYHNKNKIKDKHYRFQEANRRHRRCFKIW